MYAISEQLILTTLYVPPSYPSNEDFTCHQSRRIFENVFRFRTHNSIIHAC